MRSSEFLVWWIFEYLIQKHLFHDIFFYYVPPLKSALNFVFFLIISTLKSAGCSKPRVSPNPGFSRNQNICVSDAHVMFLMVLFMKTFFSFFLFLRISDHISLDAFCLFRLLVNFNLMIPRNELEFLKVPFNLQIIVSWGIRGAS